MSRGPAVPYANAPTQEQYQRWEALGGVGSAPYSRDAMERAISYLEAQKSGKDLVETFQVPGPASDPLDRGECLKLNTENLTRCTGRLRSKMEYHDGQGFLTIWTCTKCGEKGVV